MAKTNGDGPTQESQPKEGTPVEIPIPTREEVFRDLAKVAKPRKTDPDSDAGSAEDQS
jgi:hypothetical protein